MTWILDLNIDVHKERRIDRQMDSLNYLKQNKIKTKKKEMIGTEKELSQYIDVHEEIDDGL